MLNSVTGCMQTQTPGIELKPGLSLTAFKEQRAGLPLITWQITPQLQLLGLRKVQIGEHHFYLNTAFNGEDLFQIQLSPCIEHLDWKKESLIRYRHYQHRRILSQWLSATPPCSYIWVRCYCPMSRNEVAVKYKLTTGA